MQLCNIPHMDYIRKPEMSHFHEKGFDLTCPHRDNIIMYSSKRKPADPIKQTSHRQQAHFDTACTTVLVVFTAAWAVYTADMILALVVVSRPKVPAMRGISPADSIRPSPSKA